MKQSLLRLVVVRLISGVPAQRPQEEGGLAVLSSNSFRSPFLTSCSYNDRRNTIILLMTLPVRSLSLLFVCHIYWFRMWIRCAGVIATPDLEDTARYQVAAKGTLVPCPVPESDSDSEPEPPSSPLRRTRPRRLSGHLDVLQCLQKKNSVNLPVTQYNTTTRSLIVGEVEKAYQASGVSRREKVLTVFLSNVSSRRASFQDAQ